MIRYESYAEIRGKILPASVQRDLIPSHVIEMRKHIRQMCATGSLPIFGVIDLCLLNGIYYVVDGQHRLRALYDEYHENNVKVPFYVIVYNVTDESQITLIWKTRNANIVVPSFMVDSTINDKRKILLKGIQDYISAYPLFSPSNNKRPYVNVTSFMNKLESSRLINHVTSVQYFIEIMKGANEWLKNKLFYNTDFAFKHGVTVTMIEKCGLKNSYFGLDKSQEWMDTMYSLPNESNLMELPPM